MAGDRLRFALEPPSHLLRDAVSCIPGERGPNQLDCCRTCEHSVLGAPHFTHSPLAEALNQMVASERSRAADLGAQRVNDACTHVGHDHDEQVGKHEPEKELPRVWLE